MMRNQKYECMGWYGMAFDRMNISECTLVETLWI